MDPGETPVGTVCGCAPRAWQRVLALRWHGGLVLAAGGGTRHTGDGVANLPGSTTSTTSQ
jgi:hypothetical protein